MVPFRFRAAAALELRRQQEAEAATVLARAEAAFRDAETRLESAEADRRQAQADALSTERRGTDGYALLWHRNWIMRLGTVIELRVKELETCTQHWREAEQGWREARKRHLALERMRVRAWRRYQQAEQHADMKAMDELARLRFVMTDSWRSDA